MDSIDWSEIHHFETALHNPLFKGIAKKEIPIPTHEPKNQYGRFYYDAGLASRVWVTGRSQSIGVLNRETHGNLPRAQIV
jgi:hypothetical protein